MFFDRHFEMPGEEGRMREVWDGHFWAGIFCGQGGHFWGMGQDRLLVGMDSWL